MVLRVLYLAAEAHPFMKVGGLGDVAGALPHALSALPSAPDIRVVLPHHGSIREELECVGVVRVPARSGVSEATIHKCIRNGVDHYFLSGPLLHNDQPVYHSDVASDAPRFVWFGQAALALARHLDFAPHILHVNDWHSASAILALQAARKSEDAFFARTRSLFTIHNLPYAGHGAARAIEAAGLMPEERTLLPEGMEPTPVALCVLLADRISTVSQGYAREILTPEFGCGLETLLRMRNMYQADVLTGIRNGIDDTWDPQNDRALHFNYDEHTPEARTLNKQVLLQEVGFKKEAAIPLIGVVSRLVHQKGIDLLTAAVHRLLREGHRFSFVALGTGDADVESALQQLEQEHAGTRNVKWLSRYDDGLARRVYAGADILAIPSRYEPCGLSQMYAMKYGAVPVATETGGLADTVRDFDLSDRATGFLCSEATVNNIAFTLRRALSTYRNVEVWRALQQQGMREDFSWQGAAESHQLLYQQLSFRRPESVLAVFEKARSEAAPAMSFAASAPGLRPPQKSEPAPAAAPAASDPSPPSRASEPAQQNGEDAANGKDAKP